MNKLYLEQLESLDNEIKLMFETEKSRLEKTISERVSNAINKSMAFDYFIEEWRCNLINELHFCDTVTSIEKALFNEYKKLYLVGYSNPAKETLLLAKNYPGNIIMDIDRATFKLQERESWISQIDFCIEPENFKNFIAFYLVDEYFKDNKYELIDENNTLNNDSLQIKWKGSGKNLAELFLTLEEKGWIAKIETKIIENSFTESGSFHQYIKGRKDGDLQYKLNGYKEVFEKIPKNIKPKK